MTAESICKSGRRLISSDQPQNTFTCPIQEKTSCLGFSLEIHRPGCGNGPCTGSLPVKIGMLHSSRNWHHTPARNRKTERWDHGIPNPFSPLSIEATGPFTGPILRVHQQHLLTPATRGTTTRKQDEGAHRFL